MINFIVLSLLQTNGQQIDPSYLYLNIAKLVMKKTTYHNIYDYCFSQLLFIAKATQSVNI